MDSLPGSLAQRWPSWAEGSTRRKAAAIKHSFYREQHLGLVKGRIEARLQNWTLARDISLFATRSPNLVRAVADAVAVAYQRGCQRELRGMSEAANKAFALIVAESGIDRKANNLNAKSWLLGPTFVSPFLDQRGRLGLDIVTPDLLDARMSGPYTEALLWQDGGGYVELNAEAWIYFDGQGKEYKVVLHNLGQCPAVPFTAVDTTGDFWLANEHSGLVDAGLDCGYKMALGLYNRQVSGNKLLVIQGDAEKIPGSQSLGHPALPLILRGNPAETAATLLDRNIPASDHLAEISAIIALSVSVYGISPSEISGVQNNDWGSLGVTIRSERLGALRDKQVPFLRAAELELWPLVCDLLRSAGHRHSKDLPPGDEVRDSLRVSFPDLAPPADVLSRIEAMRAGLPFGLSSPADWLLASRPELTRHEAEELLQANLRAYLDTIEPMVSRNIPGQAPEAEGAQTVAQLQGREGGLASGESRNEESK